jgi:beta-galactosidase
VREAAAAIAALGIQETVKGQAALVFSYEAAWVCGIQPQGASFRYLELVHEFYSALRRLGLDVDVVSPEADLAGYAMVLVPTLPILPDGFVEKLRESGAQILIGPRSGSKTVSFAIPASLAPGGLRELVPLTICRVESLRDGVSEAGGDWAIGRWHEQVESALEPEFATCEKKGVVFRQGPVRYCAAWPDQALLRRVIERMAHASATPVMPLPEGLRLRRTQRHTFSFNYSAEPIDTGLLMPGEPILGQRIIPPAGFAVWERT